MLRPQGHLHGAGALLAATDAGGTLQPCEARAHSAGGLVRGAGRRWKGSAQQEDRTPSAALPGGGAWLLCRY